MGAKCAYSYQGLALPGGQVLTLVNTGTMVLWYYTGTTLIPKAIDAKRATTPPVPSTHEFTTPVLPMRG